MVTYHKVKPGDCISSIATTYGFFPDTIWYHEKNRKLRERRQNPNILWYQEDRVFVPDRESKSEDASTEQRHRFRRKGIPEILRIRFLDEDDGPRAGVPYRVDIDGDLRDGTTNGGGFLIESIEPDAELARVFLGESDQEEEYEFSLGKLPPITTVEGVQARLTNLGYYQGEVNGTVDEPLEAALGAFQDDYELKVTNEIDQATRDAIESLYLS